jgi:Ca-activated chloride channel family protein
MSLHFASPYFLVLLPLVLLVLRQQRRPSTTPVRYSSLKLLRNVPPSAALRMRWILPVLRASALTLLIVGLARPQSGRKLTEISTEGVDIILAIDASRSMEALDFNLDNRPAPRLAVVQKVVREYILKQSGNRLGLVVFGSEAFTQCPLTTDYGVLVSFVDRLKTGMAGDATAIGSALAVSTSRLKDLKAKSRVIVLLTDGASNAGPVGPIEAARAAATFGAKIYTVGIGTDGVAPMPRQTILGTFYDQVKVEFDEETLKEIAQLSGGEYFHATDTDTLQKIYDTIDKLEKTEQKVKEHMEYNELFLPFVLAGLLALLLEIALANTRLRKLP